jgi:hypothetical protein
MSDPTPIETPAGYAPAYAIGFADPAQNLILVSEADRLPVAFLPPPPDALVGQAAASAQVGPFEAVPGRIVSVTLRGSWEGTVSLLRSTDGGATLSPLRVAGQPWGQFTAPGCEQVWLETEDGASFFLDVQLVSGTLDYRVSQ